MELKRTLAKAGIAASVAAGGLAGAVIFTPGLSGAQDDEATDEETTDDSTDESTDDSTDDSSGEAGESTDASKPGMRLGRHGMHLETVAEAIGIEVDELQEALADGQTIAEAAEANGADVDAVVDSLVAAATERVEEMLAELPERMEDFVNGELGGPGAGFEARGGLDDRPGFRRHGGAWHDQADTDESTDSAESTEGD